MIMNLSIGTPRWMSPQGCTGMPLPPWSYDGEEAYPSVSSSCADKVNSNVLVSPNRVGSGREGTLEAGEIPSDPVTGGVGVAQVSLATIGVVPQPVTPVSGELERAVNAVVAKSSMDDEFPDGRLTRPMGGARHAPVT